MHDEKHRFCFIPTGLKIDPGSIVTMFRIDGASSFYYTKAKSDQPVQYWEKYILPQNAILTYLGYEVVKGLLFVKGLDVRDAEASASKWLLNNRIVYMHWTQTHVSGGPASYPSSFFRVIT